MLANVVSLDNPNGNDGAYTIFPKLNSVTHFKELRVVKPVIGRPANSYSPDACASIQFRSYIAELNFS